MSGIPIWNLELLGALRATVGSHSIARFRTRKVALLLAFLACHPKRSYSREELAEMLWPDSDPEINRRNLRQALSSLRHHLEPPGLPSGSVLVAKQSRVQFNLDYVTTDVLKFESLIEHASTAREDESKLAFMQEAVAIYHGELLPGYHEEWVLSKRLLLGDAYFFALENLAKICAKLNRTEECVGYLRLALAQEPLKEELHAQLMEQYIKSNRPSSALKQFRELENLLKSEIGEGPTERTRRLAELAAKQGGSETPAKLEDLPPALKRRVQTKSEPSVRLPVQLTRFFGRESELAAVIDLIASGQARIVTVLGSAGVGKTRFAIELGRRIGDLHRWNVWFVPLADLNSASMLYDAIVDCLNARRRGESDPIRQLRPHLTGDRSLIVLDNLEHIVVEAAPLIASLVQLFPKLVFLVTSRQAVKIEGEREILLDPLDVPARDSAKQRGLANPVSPELVVQYSRHLGVQLFVDRCQAIRPDFQITPNNAVAVAQICADLEGLPLAIEIAAGLSNAFTPSQMFRNLRNRLELLKSRRRDIPERHRSLRAAIEYSYRLLDLPHRSFFAALSVFSGGFTVDDAAAVCIENLPTKRAVRELSLRMTLDLQERSLVRSDEAVQAGEARFRLLESFREFGREQISEQDEEKLRAAYAGYFLSRLEDNADGSAVDSGVENYYASLDFFFDRGDLQASARILRALSSRWHFGGPRAFDQSYARRLVQDPGFVHLDFATQVNALRMVANTYLFASEYHAAEDCCAKALEVALLSGNDKLIAEAYGALAVAVGYSGRNSETIDLHKKSLDFALASSDLDAQETAYIGLGTMYWTLCNPLEAQLAFKSARDVCAKKRGGETDWLISYNLSRVALDLGNLDEAMQLAGESLRESRRSKSEFGISMSLSLMSRYHWLRKDLYAALAISNDALCRRKGVGFTYWTLNAIQFHAFLMAEVGLFQPACTLLAATFDTLKLERVADVREFQSATDLVKSKVSDRTFGRSWAKGLAMDLEEAFELAIQHK